MNKDLYSGEIDWERIYRTFHDPAQIAKRIKREIGGIITPIVFSGFSETASYLAQDMPVTFVDYSWSITNNAKICHRNIYQVEVGDITQLIARIPIRHVAIACRISAYWDSAEYFERLAASLLSLHRDVVLIDFFDRDFFKIGDSLIFESKGETGYWKYLGIEEVKTGQPWLSKLKIKVSYSLMNQSVCYEGYRSCFRKSAILKWAYSKFTDYNVTVGLPLLEHDPGFLLKLTRKKTPNRVAGGFSPPAPTTPSMRVRTGRFTKLTGP